MYLEVKDLTYAYGAGQEAVDHVSMNVEKGEFVGVIGPNGSGKSTLLKCIYRALRPEAGSISLCGEDVLSMSYRQSALRMAVVGQEHDIPFDFTVEEIAAMGRSPHKRMFDIDGREDRQIVADALKKLGMEELSGRSFRSLSGGEKQRVLIARALVQESDLFILDEPTNHLDIGYQLQILELVKGLGITVLAAIHDLNLAALYCDRLYVMKDGKLVLEGRPEEVLTPEEIYRVYGVRSLVERNRMTGKSSITFLPEHIDLQELESGHVA